MILAMVRHGQTNQNFKRLVQGRSDNPLNEQGKNQALMLGKLLKEMGDVFDVLGSSPLSRAYESASIIGSILDLPVSFVDESFIERDFGPHENESIDDVIPKITDDYKIEGFEHNEELLLRIHKGLLKLYGKYKDKKILLVSHSHVIKSVLILSDPKKYTYSNHQVLNSSILYFDVSIDSIKFIKQIDL